MATRVDTAPVACTWSTGGKVGIRELTRSLSAVISGVESGGQPVLVTRFGEPVVAIVPVGAGVVDADAAAAAASAARDLLRRGDGQRRAALALAEELRRMADAVARIA